MILKTLELENFGPFVNAKLALSPEVTVLTGPNDTGKSLALRAIEIVCSKKTCLEHEVNRDRANEFSGTWQNDHGVICHAEFEITSASEKMKGLPKEARKAGSIISVKRSMI